MRELIKRLIDERATAWEQAKAILDAAENEERDLTPDENTTFEQTQEAINDLSDRIDELTGIMEREKEHAEQRSQMANLLNNGGHPMDPAGDGRGDLAAALRRVANGEVRSIEIPVHDLFEERYYADTGRVEVRDLRDLPAATMAYHNVERRDLSSGTGAAGGDLIPTSFVRQLWEHFIENSAIRRTNVTVIPTTSGETLEIPKTLTHSAVSAITAEGVAIAETDPTFDKTALSAYKYGGVVQVPFELLTDSGVGLERYVTRRLGVAIANGSGTHFITGDGSSKPNGIVTASTLGVTGGTGVGGAFTADELIDLQYSVIEAYANRATWMMRRATEGTARKLKGSDNNYLWQPGLQVGTPNQLLGRPIVTDPNMPAVATSAKSVLFGDFSTYVIRDAGGVNIARSDDFAFTSDLATFKATLRTDGDLIDLTGAVKHFVGAAT